MLPIILTTIVAVNKSQQLNASVFNFLLMAGKNEYDPEGRRQNT